MSIFEPTKPPLVVIAETPCARSDLLRGRFRGISETQLLDGLEVKTEKAKNKPYSLTGYKLKQINKALAVGAERMAKSVKFSDKRFFH